jgi:hypothetical protein
MRNRSLGTQQETQGTLVTTLTFNSSIRTTKQTSQKAQSQTQKPFIHPNLPTMMSLSFLLVLAVLVNAATGNVIEEIAPPAVGTPPAGYSPGTPAPSAAPTAGPPDIPPVELGTASNYVILTKSGISTASGSSIYGDVGVSPISHAAMTGFAMSLDPGGQWSTSTQINGKAYAANYVSPTPPELTTAVCDMEAAYTNAAGRSNGDAERTNLGGGEILTPGVYTFDKDIKFSADIAFKGDENDVFIVQGAMNLLQAEGTTVTLVGGAQAKNIFWQIAGQVRVGAGSQLQGVLLVKMDVLFESGSFLNGRVLVQTACNLQSAVITEE